MALKHHNLVGARRMPVVRLGLLAPRNELVKLIEQVIHLIGRLIELVAEQATILISTARIRVFVLVFSPTVMVIE